MVFSMSVRNLKDGSKKPWICECYPTGREGRRIRKRFATKGEATSFEAFTMRTIDDKPWLGTKEDKRPLSELLTLWFNLHGKHLRSGVTTYRRLMMVCEELNDPIALRLTPTDFVHYRANRKTRGRGTGRSGGELSPASHNFDQLSLQGVFNHLIEIKEWDYPNPMLGIKKIKTGESELTFLSKTQIDDLLLFVSKSPIGDQLSSIIKICLSTGARIMEAVTLQGSQLSEYKITYINTKGKRNRTIPISKELYDELYQPTSGRVFSCGYGVVHKWLTLALPDLPKGQSTHVLRHTFASHFMMNGGNILVLQKILGHQDIKQTMAYSHFAPDHLNDAVSLNPLNTTKSDMKYGDKVAASVNNH